MVIFCLIFQFTVFHHLPQHVIYTVIYIVGLFFLKAKFGKERGQQAFRIGCQRCNVEYANEPQMLYIYIYDLCKVLFQEKCLLHFCAHYFLLFLLVKCYHFHRSETSLHQKAN